MSAEHAFALRTIYSAGTMLSLYVISISDLCAGKGKIETRDAKEVSPIVFFMQVRGWKDVITL